MTVLGALVPYAVLALSLFGTGQQAVQRFLSTKNLESARLAAVTGWTAGTVALGLTLLLGVALSSWAALAPVAKEFSVEKADQVLPAFIGYRLPAGFAGLLLAAVFAASMSSMDSAIHSMSTATIVDFVRRFWPTKPEPGVELRVARLATVSFGLWATVGAIYASEVSTSILETLVTWLGYFAGPLLGLFLLGMLTKRANETGALIGVGAAFAVVVATPAKEWGFHPLWLAPLSCAVAFGIGYAASLRR
jgi:SSS family solute:Na+ symporter